MSRDTTYDDALRSAFGRARDVSPAKAREAAQRFEDAGKYERAEALRDYAADREASAGDRRDESSSGSSSKPDTKTKAKGKKPAQQPKKRPGPVSRSAKRAAVGRPQEMVATTIDRGGSMFWTIALGTVGLVFLALVVQHSDKATQLFGALSTGVQHVAFPRRMFQQDFEAAQARVNELRPLTPPERRTRT